MYLVCDKCKDVTSQYQRATTRATTSEYSIYIRSITRQISKHSQKNWKVFKYFCCVVTWLLGKKEKKMIIF